jgi:BRCT domain type II-containing protein
VFAVIALIGEVGATTKSQASDLVKTSTSTVASQTSSKAPLNIVSGSGASEKTVERIPESAFAVVDNYSFDEFVPSAGGAIAGWKP